MKYNLGIDKIKEIANRITELRNNDFNPLTPIAERIQTYAEDETYEVDTNNYIIGITIAIDDLQFLIRKTFERDIFEIYADDSRNGEYGAINIDSRGNIENIAEFLNQHFYISFYGVKLSSIGLFYKPNNNSYLNQISEIDKETLIYLLRFLISNKIIKSDNLDFNGITETLIKWNAIKI